VPLQGPPALTKNTYLRKFSRENGNVRGKKPSGAGQRNAHGAEIGKERGLRSGRQGLASQRTGLTNSKGGDKKGGKRMSRRILRWGVFPAQYIQCKESVANPVTGSQRWNYPKKNQRRGKQT